MKHFKILTSELMFSKQITSSITSKRFTAAPQFIIFKIYKIIVSLASGCSQLYLEQVVNIPIFRLCAIFRDFRGLLQVELVAV